MTKTITARDIQASGGLQKWAAIQGRKPVAPLLLSPIQKPKAAGGAGSVKTDTYPPKDMPLRMTAKARLPHPGRTYSTEAMNQTEARYAGNLDALKHFGKVIDWKYECIKLRLADKTFYTADFFVLMADGSIEVHEVKGHWEDDAKVKIKVAAKEYPWFKFVAVKAKKRDWEYEYFGWARRTA